MRSGSSRLNLGDWTFNGEEWVDKQRAEAVRREAIQKVVSVIRQNEWPLSTVFGRALYLRAASGDVSAIDEIFLDSKTPKNVSSQIDRIYEDASAQSRYFVRVLPPEPPKPPPPPGAPVLTPKVNEPGEEGSPTPNTGSGKIPNFLNSRGFPDWDIFKWLAIAAIVGVGIYAIDFATKD